MRILASLILVFALPLMAQQPAQQTTQLTQQIGHVLSSETHHTHGTTSVYNQSTGQYSYGSSNAVERDTEIQVGNLVYSCPRVHKEVQVGKDYPVSIEIDKHGVAKKLMLLVGEKTYAYRITGTREAKAN